MLQLIAVTPDSEERSESTRSRIVASLRKRIQDGSIPLAAGGILLARALRSRGGNGQTARQILAGATLVGIGLRQRRHNRVTRADMVEDDHHTGTGTSEMRAESHVPDSNPREIEDEPSVQPDADAESIQFTEEQIDETDEDPSADDQRIDDGTTEVDLSEASMADEPAEAAGPTSDQSQPTQTDAIEPEETPEEDSLPQDSSVADEAEADDGDEGMIEEGDDRMSTGDVEDTIEEADERMAQDDENKDESTVDDDDGRGSEDESETTT